MDDVLQLRPKELGQVYRILAQDKTTKERIVWGTDNYLEYGSQYGKNKPVIVLFTNFGDFTIEPRITKGKNLRQKRTKSHAEVFTPAWVCNKMINYCDDEWFGRKNVFNTGEDKSWSANPGKIEFSGKRNWKAYVDSRRLEITCGEAPYIVSRYDTSKGQEIEIGERIGILDRKLRVVGENCENEEEWFEWAVRAFQSVYGYEMQGDNLLLCRKNLLLTFCEYLKHRWNREPKLRELKKIANIIAWNFWQMDGLKGTIPAEPEEDEKRQLSIDDFTAGGIIAESLNSACKIHNWRSRKTFLFKEVKEKGFMKFDYVIGNPPYQEEAVGDNKTYTSPVYNYFLESAYKIAERVEMIHPARFLFNAGGTQKSWNKKMLDDPHLKVLWYKADSSTVFANTDIMGGIAVTYRDTNQDFGAIGIFTPFVELNNINKKVWNIAKESLSEIVSNRGQYRFSKLAYQEQPEELKKVSDARISAPVFDRMPTLFTQDKPTDEHEYIQIYGNAQKTRVYRWFRKDYLNSVENLNEYKVMVPKANGSGAIGEVIPTSLIGIPAIGKPSIGFTETFISIGSVDKLEEAEAILKYIKTKFARVMLGILKVTQDNAKPVWKCVPLQDFTENSDIDWSVSVAEIDRQLYRKYGLSEEEISFIETHVKEME